MNVEETIVDCRAETAEYVRVFRISMGAFTRLTTGTAVHPGDREGSMSATILGFDKAEPVCERTTQNDLF